MLSVVKEYRQGRFHSQQVLKTHLCHLVVLGYIQVQEQTLDQFICVLELQVLWRLEISTLLAVPQYSPHQILT